MDPAIYISLFLLSLPLFLGLQGLAGWALNKLEDRNAGKMEEQFQRSMETLRRIGAGSPTDTSTRPNEAEPPENGFIQGYTDALRPTPITPPTPDPKPPTPEVTEEIPNQDTKPRTRDIIDY